jgi:hypothetical protein
VNGKFSLDLFYSGGADIEEIACCHAEGFFSFFLLVAIEEPHSSSNIGAATDEHGHPQVGQDLRMAEILQVADVRWLIPIPGTVDQFFTSGNSRFALLSCLSNQNLIMWFRQQPTTLVIINRTCQIYIIRTVSLQAHPSRYQTLENSRFCMNLILIILGMLSSVVCSAPRCRIMYME